jgi:tetratricopeptide (TPR) repeat protein
MRRDLPFASILTALLLAALSLGACKDAAPTTDEVTPQPADSGGAAATSETINSAEEIATSEATPQPTATATLTPSPTPGPDLDTLLQTPAAMYTSADLDTAQTTYDELITLYPDRAEPWLGLASLAMRRGDETAALDLVHNATEADPASFEAWRQMAVLLEHARAYDEAVEAYSQLIELVPDDPDLYISRALVAGRLGDGDQAVADLEQAQALDPYREYAWLNVAGAAFGGRHYDAAAAIAAAGLEHYPVSTELYVLQGQARLSTGDPEAALEALDAATTANPQSALALRWRAEALDVLGRTTHCPQRPGYSVRLSTGKISALRAAIRDPMGLRADRAGTWRDKQRAQPAQQPG